MIDQQDPASRGAVGLLRYRPLRVEFAGPWNAVWAIARTSLGIMFRRKMFWGLYGLAVLSFLFFFFGQYLMFWLKTQLADQRTFAGGSFFRGMNSQRVVDALANGVMINGSAYTYGNLIWFEGFIVMIVLALVGSIIIGNDFHFGSLPFYLSKPITRWHYLAGKGIGIAVFVNMMTTIPALLLYLQFGFISDWEYPSNPWRLLIGLLGYGLMITVTLVLLLLATSVWLRRAVPMIMVWAGVFVLGKLLAKVLVDAMKYDPSWRLIDLWNNLWVVGHWFMGTPHDQLKPTRLLQPAYHEAFLVLVGVCAACLIYLNRRIRAVEVVS